MEFHEDSTGRRRKQNKQEKKLITKPFELIVMLGTFSLVCRNHIFVFIPGRSLDPIPPPVQIFRFDLRFLILAKQKSHHPLTYCNIFISQLPQNENYIFMADSGIFLSNLGITLDVESYRIASPSLCHEMGQ